MLALQDYSATIGRLPLHIDIHGVGLAPLDLWVQVEPLEGVDSGGVLCEVVSQDALQSASEGRSRHQGLVVGVVQPLGKEHGGTGAGTYHGWESWESGSVAHHFCLEGKFSFQR